MSNVIQINLRLDFEKDMKAYRCLKNVGSLDKKKEGHTTVYNLVRGPDLHTHYKRGFLK